MKVFRNNERGQALVEFVLVASLFLGLLFAIIDLSWMGYNYSCFDISVRASSWDIPGDYSAYGPEAEMLIKNAMEPYAIGLNMNNLYVDNASISAWNEREDLDYYIENSNRRVVMNKTRKYMSVEGEVIYVFHSLTPIGELIFGNPIKIKRNLNKLKILTVET